MQLNCTRIFSCVIACAMTFGTLCFGQQTLGVIDGNISEESGATIANAAVTAANNSTGFTRTTQSGQDGSFAFQNLPIGTYQVTVSKDSFETENYPTIRVQEGHTTSLQVKLKVGKATESVIASGSPLLNSVDTTNGYVLDNAQVEQLPLATGSFTQLAVLAPGANAQFINGTGANEG
jgi:Carboxypeptidase regulatory-like domain